MLSVKCPQCSGTNAAPERLAGKRVKCAKCGHGFVLPQKPARRNEQISELTGEMAEDVYKLAVPECAGTGETAKPLSVREPLPKSKSPATNGWRTLTRPSRTVPLTAAKYALERPFGRCRSSTEAHDTCGTHGTGWPWTIGLFTDCSAPTIRIGW